MHTLGNGYVYPFESQPPICEEPNNKSAVQNPVFANKAIGDLHELGITAFTDVKPHCVSPLTVSLETGRDGLTKKGLCWDGSGCVNSCLRKRKVAPSHLQKAWEIAKDRDFQVARGLRAAYHHVGIDPSQTISRLIFQETKRWKAMFCFSFSTIWVGVGGALHHWVIKTW